MGLSTKARSVLLDDNRHGMLLALAVSEPSLLHFHLESDSHVELSFRVYEHCGLIP